MAETSEYDPHISINTSIQAKDSEYYYAKEIELEHLNKKALTPLKILEGKRISENAVNNINKNLELPIYESSVYLVRYPSWKNFFSLVEEEDEKKISGLNSMMGLRVNLWKSSLFTFSFVFSKNPFIANGFSVTEKDNFRIQKKVFKQLPPLSEDGYISFLDYLHTVSKAFILAPDIIIRNSKDSINIDSYLNFVDITVKSLSNKNKKPIFVPLQVRLSRKHLNKILNHYKKQGYVNIWLNLNASQIGGTYFAHIRTVIQLIEDIFGLNNVTLYHSHIKKEIEPNISDERVTSSDILPQFFCADFIGVNREPYRVITEPEKLEAKILKRIEKGEFKSIEEYKKAQQLNKTRIFDSSSYYYYNVPKHPFNMPKSEQDTLINYPDINRLYNSYLLNIEVENVKTIVNEENKLKPYIKQKEAIQNNGDILFSITKNIQTSQKKQKGLEDFL